ncbi:hypothetical protein NMY22_g12389 [Coprinellus aureogranulatus]|nr:hypothetical protein NMY22_g12389 [Coprinellus aureogranulatus]
MATALADSLKGDVITRDHPEYDASIARWVKNSERQARFVAFVKDVEDVAAAISYAKAHKLPIAIRSGGINLVASSVEDGLVIDLSRHLNKVRVDADSRLAYVGGGALWKDVDAETIKHGLATPGTFANYTGVGGMTVNGGYNWLSGRHGLILDNLVQATVVTADGSTLTVSDTENPDLFWAIRGGGGDFGVVTEFVYRLHPQRATVFGGLAIFTPDKLEKLVEVTKRWYATISEDAGLFLITATAPTSPCIIATIFFNGSEEEGRANFKDIFDVGPATDTCGEITYEQVVSLLNGHGHRVPGGMFTRAVAPEALLYPTAEAMDFVTKIYEGGQHYFLCLYEYLPITKTNSIDPAATAIPRPLRMNVQSMLQWDGNSPQQTLDAKKIVGKHIGVLMGGQGAFGSPSELTESYGDGTNPIIDFSKHSHQPLTSGFADVIIPSEYLPNPIVLHTPNSPQSIFKSNYPRLLEVKRKYDPDNVFDAFGRWAPIALGA